MTCISMHLLNHFPQLDSQNRNDEVREYEACWFFSGLFMDSAKGLSEKMGRGGPFTV